MTIAYISDFILINSYFYKCCIIDYDTSYKNMLSIFDGNNTINIFNDVYNLYLAIYLFPRLISPLTLCKLKISNDDYYNKYINFSLKKCYINKDNYKNNKIFINNILEFINNKK